MKSLVDFEEYVGESGASIQQRYLATLYLACADYTESIMGQTFIQVDDFSKQIVLGLSGISDRPEENLVGLEYEVDFSDSRSDERFGSIFIITTFNEETGLYEPFLMASEENENGVPVTSYYVSPIEGRIAYFPVVAKGVMTADGLPTAIRSSNGFIEFYRDDVVIRNASELKLEMYFQSTETVASNLNPIIQLVVLTVNGITGKDTKNSNSDMYPRVTADSLLSLPFGKQTTFVYHLSDGSANVNYLFKESSGITVEHLYEVNDLNIIVLALGSVMLALALIRAMFGLIKILYEMIVLLMVFPALCSTYVFSESRLNKWKNQFIPKLLVGFGMVIGFNFYFMVVRLISTISFFDANTDLSVLQTSWMFYWVKPEMLNSIAHVLFNLVAVLLLQSVPSMINKILGAEDVFDKGVRTISEVKDSIQTASDIASGYALQDAVTRNVQRVTAFIPDPKKLVGVLPKKAQEKANELLKAREKEKEKKKQEKKRAVEQAKNHQRAEKLKKDLQKKGYSGDIAEKRAKEYEQKLNASYDEEQKRRAEYKKNQQKEAEDARKKREEKRAKAYETREKWIGKDKEAEEKAKEKEAKANAKAKKKEKK